MDLKKAFGNPGIWGYCKKAEYESFLKQLDERGYFNDLERSGGKIAEYRYREFQYKDSIVESDFSHEPFHEEDIVVGLWCVSKEHLQVKPE